MSKPGASLVLAGPHQPVVVQLLAYGINAALKNIGKTLMVREFPRNPARRTAFSQLAERHGCGPDQAAFHLRRRSGLQRAPRPTEIRETKQPLDWADLQKKVPEVVSLGYYEDATSASSQWHVPMAHYLESWGDALTSEGAYLAIQPMILPLFGGVSEIEMMNMLPRRTESSRDRNSFRKHFAQRSRRAISKTAWSKFLHDGFASHIQLRDKPRDVQSANRRRHGAHALGVASPRRPPDSPEIVLVRSYCDR